MIGKVRHIMGVYPVFVATMIIMSPWVKIAVGTKTAPSTPTPISTTNAGQVRPLACWTGYDEPVPVVCERSTNNPEQAQTALPVTIIAGNKFTSVVWSPDSNKLVETNQDGVWLYDKPRQAQSTPRRFVSSSNNFQFASAAFSPDDKILAVGVTGHTVVLWDVASGKQLATLTTAKRIDDRNSSVQSIAFSPDGKTLAAASDDHTVVLWDVASGRPLESIIGYVDIVSSSSFSSDSKTFISGSLKNSLQLWDVASGEDLTTVVLVSDTPDFRKGAHVYNAVLSPDGKGVATAVWLTGCIPNSRCGTLGDGVQLWDIASGKLIASAMSSSAPSFYIVGFSADGKVLTVAHYDGAILQWDVASGKVQGQTEQPAYNVYDDSFSPDRTIVVSAEYDGTVGLWNATTDKRLATLTVPVGAVQSVAFSPDGTMFASISANIINGKTMWDTVIVWGQN